MATRGLGDAGNDLLLVARPPVPDKKVEFGIPDLRAKKFQHKKNRPPARKNLSHVSRSRDLFLFGLNSYIFACSWFIRPWPSSELFIFFF